MINTSANRAILAPFVVGLWTQAGLECYATAKLMKDYEKFPGDFDNDWEATDMSTRIAEDKIDE